MVIYKVFEDDVVERKLVVVGIPNNLTCYIRCHGKSVDIFFLISLATLRCGFQNLGKNTYIPFKLSSQLLMAPSKITNCVTVPLIHQKCQCLFRHQ
jgi:hypothetical protein